MKMNEKKHFNSFLGIHETLPMLQSEYDFIRNSNPNDPRLKQIEAKMGLGTFRNTRDFFWRPMKSYTVFQLNIDPNTGNVVQDIKKLLDLLYVD
jgi:hypothetical protein